MQMLAAGPMVEPVVEIEKLIVDVVGPRVTSQHPDMWGTSDPVSSIQVTFNEDIAATHSLRPT